MYWLNSETLQRIVWDEKLGPHPLSETQEATIVSLAEFLKNDLHQHRYLVNAVLFIHSETLSQDADLFEPLMQEPRLFVQFVLIGKKIELDPMIRDNLHIILPDLLPDTIESLMQSLLRLNEESIQRRQNELRLHTYESYLDKLSHVGRSMATEQDFERLIDIILQASIEIVHADGGSLYLVDRERREGPKNLRFKRSFLNLDAHEFLLPIDNKSIAGYVALTNEPLNLDDVHNMPPEAPFRYNSDYDKAHSYYTKSMLVIPMVNQRGEVIGVLQMINRKHHHSIKLSTEEMKSDKVFSFTQSDFSLLYSLAGQAGIAIENQILVNEQKQLLGSFIDMIAKAIDTKSRHTGAHCSRVPILTEMIADVACKSKEGIFSDFSLSPNEWYEFKVAAGLHDCGKITTPVWVMDKSTKLEKLADRLDYIKMRLEILKRDLKLKEHYESLGEGNPYKGIDLNQFSEKGLEEISEFLTRVNQGSESLSAEDAARIRDYANIQFASAEGLQSLITEDEKENLLIQRGTLNNEERLIINWHIVETIRMLESLPFPKELERVPEYAGGHHERMDGEGYPRGLYGKQMSIPARIMAVADIFEALTAQDRPYKQGKTLSEALEIMGKMKEENHFDPDIFDLFIREKVYLRYAEVHLPPNMIDEIDEEKLLAIKPGNIKRKHDERDKDFFLPDYRGNKDYSAKKAVFLE